MTTENIPPGSPVIPNLDHDIDKIDLPELLAARRDNPLIRYGSPWRRGWTVLLPISGLLLWPAAHTALWMQASMANFGWWLLSVFTAPLLLVPLLFLMGVVPRKEHRLEEYYLTRLTRVEVAFGSLYWGLLLGALSAIVYSAAIFVGIAVHYLRESAWGLDGRVFWELSMFGALMACFCLLLLSLLLKAMRYWLMFHRHQWRILIVAPLSVLPEVITTILVVYIVGAVLVSPAHIAQDPATFLILGVIACVLSSFLLWNLRFATRWAVFLFYQPLERHSGWSIFLFGTPGLGRRERRKDG